MGASTISSTKAPGGWAAIRRAASATASGLSIRLRSGGLGIASQKGVSTAPGDSAATRTPRPRTSEAEPGPARGRPLWTQCTPRTRGSPARPPATPGQDGPLTRRQHRRERGPAQKIRRGQVRPRLRVPVLETGRLEGPECACALRRHEAVEASEPRGGGLDRPVRRVLLRGVTRRRDRRTSGDLDRPGPSARDRRVRAAGARPGRPPGRRRARPPGPMPRLAPLTSATWPASLELLDFDP